MSALFTILNIVALWPLPCTIPYTRASDRAYVTYLRLVRSSSLFPVAAELRELWAAHDAWQLAQRRAFFATLIAVLITIVEYAALYILWPANT